MNLLKLIGIKPRDFRKDEPKDINEMFLYYEALEIPISYQIELVNKLRNETGIQRPKYEDVYKYFQTNVLLFKINRRTK